MRGRGHVRPRGKTPGHWYIIIEHSPDPNTGKRRQQWIRFVGTRTQAQQKLTNLLGKRDRSELAEPTKMTVAEWLDRWVSWLGDSGQRKPGTISRYTGIVNQHFKPHLGRIPLQALNPAHLQDYYHDVDVSPGVKALHHTLLHFALRWAVQMGFLTSNPADRVPDRPRKPKHNDEVPKALSAEEARRLLAAAREQGLQVETLLTLALETGMRLGELLGLAWREVDLDKGVLRVSCTLKNAKPPPLFGTPKNGKARTVRITPETARLLRRHRAAQAELKLANRDVYRDWDLVFAKGPGEVFHPRHRLGDAMPLRQARKQYLRPAIAKAGVKSVNFHGLRHTAATLMLQAGVSPHVVQRILGHQSLAMTMNIYAHVLPDMEEDACRKMGGLLRG